jgi:monoamine oxidase
VPTLYTALRAQHRHTLKIPKQIPLPTPTRLVTVKPLLAAEQDLVALHTAPHIRHLQSERSTKKIIIVGAGLAGLCAAYELHALGYEAVLYEARDRVGGRVHSLRDFILGKTVEGGAELIGSNHPLWCSYARNFGLSFSDVNDYGNSPIRFGGRTLTFEESSMLTDDMEEQLKRLTQLAESIIDPFEPWTNQDAEHLDSVSLSDWLRTLPYRSKDDLCRRAIEQLLAADNGIPPSEQSLLAVLAMVKGGGLDRYWTDTEVFRCENGSQQLAEKFRDALKLEGASVSTEARVKSIQVGESGIDVGVLLNGEKEKHDSANDIILAVPPSVWGKIEFKNDDLANRLKRPPQMGWNVKYLMSFRKRFWQDFASSPTLTEDGPVDLTWETTEQDKDGNFAMVAFSGADDARKCVDWNLDERRQNYLNVLNAPYPGIDQYVEKTEFMNWPNEEWTKASYYFPQVNEVTTWGPFWKTGYGGRLHFAGEHTCYAFIGYMEGALTSGYRLARRLAVRDGLLPA